MHPLLQKTPICDSVFDVAFWLIGRAHNDGERLQPQKLQRLLYLAQAYHGTMPGGLKLMPCVFVTTALGPVEPASWRAFESGPPNIATMPIPKPQTAFLNGLWRRFGVQSTASLTASVTGHAPYRAAAVQGTRAEISFESMVTYYGRNRNSGTVEAAAPPRSRSMLSHKGRVVQATSWVPKRFSGDGRS